MARTKQNQRSANRGTAVPVGTTGGRTPPSKLMVMMLAASILAVLWVVAMLTVTGQMIYRYIWAYSEFYMGVVALVALSITVMLGVVATDRLILSIRQRVLLQSAHRTMGVIAVGGLAIHLITKMGKGLITPIDIFIPFLNPGTERYFYGLGTIAGITMTSVLWTGFIRSRFAGRGKPWMWRALHSIAYLSWPIAIVHGLSAGRAAKTFVFVGYILCVLVTLLYLAVRFSVSLNRRKDFSSTATGAMKPVGSLVPTSSPKMKSRGKRSDGPMGGRVVSDRSNAPVAALDAWVPAAPAVNSRPAASPAAPVSARPAAPVSAAPMSAAPMSAAPVSSRPVSSRPVSSRPVSSRPTSSPAAPVSSRPYDDEAYRGDSRSRRYVDDEPAPRSRRDRAAADEGYEDERYDDASRSRSRRYAEDDEPVAPRARRYGDDERFDEATRPMSRRALEDGARRYAEADEPPAPRSRRSPAADEVSRSRSRDYVGDDEPVASRQRRGRGGEIDARDRFAEEDRPTSRSRRYADDEDRAPRQRFSDERFDDVPRPRPPRYDAEPAPRGRRDRMVDGDPGRPGRGGLGEPADPWRAGADRDLDYPPPDDTPTLIDMASRRARRTTPEVAGTRGASRGARSKGRDEDETADDMYWRQLRGEAN